MRPGVTGGLRPPATIWHAYSVKTHPLPQVVLTSALAYARATANCSLAVLLIVRSKQQGPALYGLALMPLENEMRFGSIRVLDLPTHFCAGSLKIRHRVTMDLDISGSIKLRKRSPIALRSSSERRARSAANAGPILSAAAMFAVPTQTK